MSGGASSRGLVVLIRHGETDGNAERIVQTPETPLNESGLRQAAALAARLEREAFRIERIVASDLARAAMTAEAVKARLAVPLEFDALLHERNFGDLRGTPYRELEFDLFAEGYEPPAGESWASFHDRVRRAWQAVEARAAQCREGALAVVTHGLVCGALVRREIGHAVGDEMRFGNTAVTLLRAAKLGAGARDATEGARWNVERLACTEHLDAGFEDDRTSISGI